MHESDAQKVEQTDCKMITIFKKVFFKRLTKIIYLLLNFLNLLETNFFIHRFSEIIFDRFFIFICYENDYFLLTLFLFSNQ